MREILFRGKRDYNGEWVYGSLLVWPDDSPEILHPNPDVAGEQLKVIVRPETVGQYTGLTDKNGKKIFEGDILKAADIFTVDFCEESFVLKFHNIGRNIGMDYFHEHYVGKMEVIGNIHDNPELFNEGGT